MASSGLSDMISFASGTKKMTKWGYYLIKLLHVQMSRTGTLLGVVLEFSDTHLCPL